MPRRRGGDKGALSALVGWRDDTHLLQHAEEVGEEAGIEPAV